MSTNRCGAKTRSGSACKQAAGWGTDHPGRGKCKLHGGASPGAKPGNGYAVTTGAYEAIYIDQLPAEEAELVGRIDVTPKAQAEEEIRLLSIRERRMLGRMRTILDDPDSITVTQLQQTKGSGSPFGSGMKVDVTAATSEHYIERVQRIEQALTRVQAQKTRAIEQYRRILEEEAKRGEETEDPLADLAEAIRASVAT